MDIFGKSLQFFASDHFMQGEMLPDLPSDCSSECFHTGLEWNPIRVLLLVFLSSSGQEEHESHEDYILKVKGLSGDSDFQDFRSLLSIFKWEMERSNSYLCYTKRGLQQDFKWRILRNLALPLFSKYKEGMAISLDYDQRDFYRELRNIARREEIYLSLN